MIRYHKLRALVAAFLLLFGLPAVNAAEEAFSVRLPVESQQAEVREQALAKAIAQVLMRMTGRDDIVEDPAVAPLMEQPGRFLQRYKYESQPGERLVLSMQFDGPGLRRALAERGVPTWGADRPPTLVWLAVEEDGRRLLVGGEEGGEIRAQFQDAASRRGLLLLFPLMDGEDQQRIGSADVFGGFTDRIRAASERYGTPLMVVGRMYRDGGAWTARWTLIGTEGSAWATSGSTRAEALDAAAGELAERLAVRYAVVPSAGERERLVVRVIGIDSLRSYTRLERRLRDIGGVSDVRPLTLESDSVVLQLSLQTTPDRVLNALQTDRMLVAVGALDRGPLESTQEGFQEPVFRLTP